MASSQKKLPIDSSSPNGLFPDEHTDIRIDVADLFADPGEWLRVPNPHLAWQKPEDVIGTDREQWLRDLLRRIKHGVPT